MRRWLSLSLAILLLLGGCEKGEPIPSELPTPRPTPAEVSALAVEETVQPTSAEVSAPVMEETVQPVLDYETVSDGYSIQRRRLDPKGLGLNVYFDVPVFEETGEGYEKINAFFGELADTFFSPKNPNLENIWDAARDGRADLYYKWTAQVTFWNERIVSATHYYKWMAGGVQSRGRNGYTFSVATGEPLTLAEVTGKSEEELRAVITGALKQTLETRSSDVESCLAKAAEYKMEDFDFALDEDGRIMLYFDSGELGRSTAESAIVVHSWLMADAQWDTWR